MQKRGRTVVTNAEVYQCIVDMTTANPRRTASRQAVADDLGVPFELVDAHFDRLLDAGRIRRVIAGVFEPTDILPNKIISVTQLPEGNVRVDIGDVCVDLNQADIRTMLSLLGGHLLFSREALQSIRDRTRGRDET
jgi:hypothetical protein